MLDRLVGGTVFSKANRIMGHHINDLLLHQGAQTNCRTRIIGEHQECASKRDHSLVESHAIHHRSHAMFARPVMQIATLKGLGVNAGAALGLRVVSRCQIC